MKKRLLFLAGGALLLAVSGLTMFGFVNQEGIEGSLPTENSAPPQTCISIYCPDCTTSDYATIVWKGWTSDCQGYTPDWVNDGTFYFNSSGSMTHYLSCELYKLIADIHVYCAEAYCPYEYFGTIEGAYCNDTVSLYLNLSDPWPCPDR